MKLKRILCAAMTLVMSLSLMAPAYATEVVDGQGESIATVTQEATTFSVTVVSGLPVNVAADGTVTVATNAEITNNSAGPIEVKSASLESANDWELVDFSTDFSGVQVGSTQYSFQLQGSDVPTTGVCDVSNFTPIGGGDSIALTYDAGVAAQSQATTETIANVTFVIGWSEGGSESSEPTPSTPTGYTLKALEDIMDEDGNVTMNVNDQVQFEAVATYSTEAPSWDSSNKTVVTITGDGLATAIGPGTSTITYTNNGVSGSLIITVLQPLQSISLHRKFYEEKRTENKHTFYEFERIVFWGAIPHFERFSARQINKPFLNFPHIRFLIANHGSTIDFFVVMH